MPIYTRTGDDGTTGLFGNERVPKGHLRIAAYGTVDEVNATLGLLRAEPLPDELDQRLSKVQDTLFELGADLATPGATPGAESSVARVQAATADLETWIDQSETQLPALHSFILPGGQREAALLHLARTTVRRAERLFWTLHGQEADVPAALGIYLNRLSDLFFSWARLCNQRHDVADVPWRREPRRKPGAGSQDPGGS